MEQFDKAVSKYIIHRNLAQNLTFWKVFHFVHHKIVMWVVDVVLGGGWRETRAKENNNNNLTIVGLFSLCFQRIFVFESCFFQTSRDFILCHWCKILT